MTNTQKIAAVPLAALLLLGGGAIAGYASLADAQTPTQQNVARERPGVMGTVASISGSTITVTDKDGTTYTVNAGSAAVVKHVEGQQGPQTGSLQDIAVGDTIAVRGTLSGTTVAATEIMEGMPFGKMGGPGHRGGGVHGTISGINGSTLTITNTDGTSYTVDASSAKLSKTVDISVADLKVGDTVGVMGQVNGTSVTAQHIMSGTMPAPQAPPANN